MKKEIITDAMKIRQVLHTYWYRNFLENVFNDITKNLNNARVDADHRLIYANVNYQNPEQCPSNAMFNLFNSHIDELLALIKVNDSTVQDPKIYFTDRFYNQMLYDTFVMGDTYMIKL